MNDETHEEKIRLLIVDDNPSKLDNLTRLLQFEPDIELVGSASSGAEGVESYISLEPDVVLMDVGLPDFDGFEAAQRILEQDLLAEVILLASESTVENYKKAMRVGAAYVWAMPLDAGKLAESVRISFANRKKARVQTGNLVLPPGYAPLDAGPQGKLIVVFSGKGGTGVTTLAINLALALHSSETPAVLVDADLQFGDVAVCLNLQNRFSILDLTDREEGLDDELIGQVLIHHESGLDVLAAPHSPEQGDEVTRSGLERLIEALRRNYAYIIVDSDSYLNDISVSLFEAADLILSVLLPDIPSIKNAKALLDTLAKLDISQEKLLLVMNQVEKRDKIRAEQVSENLHHPVLLEIPYDREAVKSSINRGQPMLTDRKTHPLVKQLLELVGEVRERLLKEREAEFE